MQLTNKFHILLPSGKTQTHGDFLPLLECMSIAEKHNIKDFQLFDADLNTYILEGVQLKQLDLSESYFHNDNMLITYRYNIKRQAIILIYGVWNQRNLKPLGIMNNGDLYKRKATILEKAEQAIAYRQIYYQYEDFERFIQDEKKVGTDIDKLKSEIWSKENRGYVKLKNMKLSL